MNNVSIIGRLVADPELKTTPSGVSVTSFGIAVQRPRTAKDGERIADFIDIVAWRGTAEFICKYFKKGQQIAITGAIQSRLWKDKNGNNRKAVEVVAEKVSFCGSNGNGSSTVKADAAQGAPEIPEEWAEIKDDGDLPF